MPYATTNPPALALAYPIASPGRLWAYRSVDAATLVRVSGYITNAKDLGIRVGDQLVSTDIDAAPPISFMHTVLAINANGSADLSDGVSLGANAD